MNDDRGVAGRDTQVADERVCPLVVLEVEEGVWNAVAREAPQAPRVGRESRTDQPQPAPKPDQVLAPRDVRREDEVTEAPVGAHDARRARRA